MLNRVPASLATSDGVTGMLADYSKDEMLSQKRMTDAGLSRQSHAIGAQSIFNRNGKQSHVASQRSIQSNTVIDGGVKDDSEMLKTQINDQVASLDDQS